MISNESPDGPAGTASPLAPRSAGSALQSSGAAILARMRGLNVSVLREVALLPVLVLLLVVGTVVSPVFLTVSNMAGIGQQISALGVVVVGESLILMIGGMDLSLEVDVRPRADGRGLADPAGRRLRQRRAAQSVPWIAGPVRGWCRGGPR